MSLKGILKDYMRKKREFCISEAEKNYKLYLKYTYTEREYVDFFMKKFINSDDPLAELDKIPKEITQNIGKYKILSENYKERTMYFLNLSKSKKLYFIPMRLLLRKFK